MRRTTKPFIAVAMFAMATLAMARTDQNSFVNRPANSLPALIQQIDKEADVTSRYTRHFGMTKDEVLAMVSKLKLARLPSDGVYVVYNAPKWEEIRSRALLFKKGTLVWVDQDGRPVLKASCGNPMVRGTDIGSALVAASVNLQPSEAVRDLQPMYPETEFVEFEPSLIAPAPMEVSAADVMPVTPNVQLIPPVAPPLGIIPIIGLLFINHGGDDIVPEPASMTALGFGVLAMVARRRRKSNR